MSDIERLRVVLVGGSGFLGSGLRTRLVASGHDVTVLGRGPSASHDGWQAVNWDAKSVGAWAESLDGVDAVVHLAGKRVDSRPTPRNIDELISSREQTVRLVGQVVEGLDKPPSAWVQLSSLGIFGDSGDEVITEQSAPPSSGLRQQVEVCHRWEAAFRDVTANVERTVLLRPGISIGGSGDPATQQLAQLARFGLGGKVGTGRQWVSWLSAKDFFDLLVRSVVDQTMQGTYHLTSPNPVRNHELMAAYRAAIGRRFGLPSPRLVATVGAWILGSDPALALTGRRCVPQRLMDEGYEFRSPTIGTAVAEAVEAM